MRCGLHTRGWHCPEPTTAVRCACVSSRVRRTSGLGCCRDNLSHKQRACVVAVRNETICFPSFFPRVSASLDKTQHTRRDKAIDEGYDTSVCLLNYRADGTTFWNQFFVASLRDGKGDTVNYVGVQCKVGSERGWDVAGSVGRLGSPSCSDR